MVVTIQLAPCGLISRMVPLHFIRHIEIACEVRRNAARIAKLRIGPRAVRVAGIARLAGDGGHHPIVPRKLEFRMVQPSSPT